MTGLAGEFLVAAELLRRGILAYISFGSAKEIDILAYNARTKRRFSVPVQALLERNAFPITHDRVDAQHIHVFLILNIPGQAVQYFVVSGKALANEPNRFSK